MRGKTNERGTLEERINLPASGVREGSFEGTKINI